MKVRASLIAVAVLLSIAWVGLVFAQDSASARMSPDFKTKWDSAKVSPFQGTVAGHDVACHCIVITGAEGKLTLADNYAKFDQEYDKVKGLKVGEPASGSYKTIDEINYATEVHQK